jgi:hypothetical protein
MEHIKNTLISEANNSKYGTQVDRSTWSIGTAKKDIIQRGVLCLKKGEQVLLNQNVLMLLSLIYTPIQLRKTLPLN